MKMTKRSRLVFILIVVSMVTATISYGQETIVDMDQVANPSMELTSDTADTLSIDNFTTDELQEDNLEIISDESQSDTENITTNDSESTKDIIDSELNPNIDDSTAPLTTSDENLDITTEDDILSETEAELEIPLIPLVDATDIPKDISSTLIVDDWGSADIAIFSEEVTINMPAHMNEGWICFESLKSGTYTLSDLSEYGLLLDIFEYIGDDKVDVIDPINNNYELESGIYYINIYRANVTEQAVNEDVDVKIISSILENTSIPSDAFTNKTEAGYSIITTLSSQTLATEILLSDMESADYSFVINTPTNIEDINISLEAYANDIELTDESIVINESISDIRIKDDRAYRLSIEIVSNTNDVEVPIDIDIIRKQAESTITEATLVPMMVQKDVINYLPINGLGITSFMDKQFTVDYDSNKLQIDKIAAHTNETSTEASELLNAQIKIISISDGKIVFESTKNIPSEKAWSGLITLISFIGIEDGETSITIN